MSSRIFTFIVCLGFLFQAHSQKPVVLIEEFTNTGCGPCASFAPVLDKAVDEHLGDVISVKFHGSYPDNNDPFYLSQKEILDRRLSFYGIDAVPTTILNGQKIGHSMNAAMLDLAIEDAKANLKPQFELSLTTSVEGHALAFRAAVKAKDDLQGDYRLFVVAIEEYVKAVTPWPNGETEAHNTMRMMMPDGNGHALGTDIAKGTELVYEDSRQLANFDNEDELGVVAFVQEMKSKAVVAACYVPKKAKTELGIEIKKLEDTPDQICLPDYYGKVVFRNVGSEQLTSATLNVSVNGTVATYPWQGSLDYIGTDTINFDGFSDFALVESGKNRVEVWMSDINGGTTVSNTVASSFSNSIQAKGAVQLRIYTDRKPEETTWKVFDSEGSVVQEGGPYTEPRHFYTENLKLESDDCYMLEFYDAGGNGIIGGNGNGYYMLYQLEAGDKKNRIAQGDYSGKVHNVAFRLTGADISLGIAGVAADTEAGTVRVYDAAGKLLLSAPEHSFDAARLAELGKGVRVVCRGSGKDAVVSKVVIE